MHRVIGDRTYDASSGLVAFVRELKELLKLFNWATKLMLMLKLSLYQNKHQSIEDLILALLLNLSVDFFHGTVK